MPKIQIHDPGKLLLFALLLVCATLLRAFDRVGVTEWGIVTAAVLGYLTGNGLLASKGRVGTNALGPVTTALTQNDLDTLLRLAAQAGEDLDPRE